MLHRRETKLIQTERKQQRADNPGNRICPIDDLNAWNNLYGNRNIENSEDALTAAGQDTHIAVSDHYILFMRFII